MSLAARALIALSLALALFLAGYAKGKTDEHRAAESEKLAAVSRAVEQANQLADEDAQILATADIKRATRRERARQLDEEIDRNVAANPAYLECGLDADGLRLWNAANAGYDTEVPGQRGYGLPAAPLGTVGQARGPNEEPQERGGPVPRLPGPLPHRPGAGQER